MATTNKCKKCGCEDTFLTSPAPCPTPAGCPNPEPCSEVFDAECVIYTGNVLTSGITVEEAIDELAAGGGGGGLTIPNLKVGALKGEVFVSLDFYDNASWLDYNPKIFLFRTKVAKKPRDPSFNGRPSQFVHTTHMAGGSGSKWFKGSLQYPGQFGGNPILRHTEFTVAETIPYKRFNLTTQGMSPYEWITYNKMDCTQINIFYNTGGSNDSQSLTSLGTLNSRPYYQFTISGENFQLFYDPLDNGWIVRWDGDGTNEYSCFYNSFSSCPPPTSWDTPNITSGPIIFNNFNIGLVNEYPIKRQALAADIVDYASNGGVNTIGNQYYVDKGYYFSINSQDSIGGYNFSKQKIHFKLAIVIDNPNATPDKPFLIGPMSDAFVLRFVKEVDSAYAKFTNDYLSKIIT